MHVRGRSLLVVIAVVAAACGHGDSFSIAPTGSDLPFNPAPPIQVTLSPGTDQDAAWLPDESGFLYSADRPDQGGDRCIELLPPGGGRATASWCAGTLASRDSINTFDASAESPAGDLAYVRSSRPPTQAAPRFTEIAIARHGDVMNAESLQAIPFTVGTTSINDVAQIRWLDSSAIVYRGGFRGTVCIAPPGVNSPCPLALVRTGRVLVRQAAAQGPPVPIPGTAQATSVAVDRDPDVIYFTLVGDSRIYRAVVSTGAITIMHDFGATIARDVQVSGSRAVAVIRGSVQQLDPALNPGAPPLQYDLGGVLTLVDLGSGAETQLSPDTLRYRNPSLSPGGHRLVAERNGDLWLFNLP